MKNQAIKFIALCAIVCGLAANANAQTAPIAAPGGAQMGKMSSEQRVEMRLNKLKSSLNLTDAQTAQVKTLLQDEVTARSSGDREAMKANHEKMKTEMGKILTPDQLTKYNQMMEQHPGKMHMGASQPEN